MSCAACTVYWVYLCAECTVCPRQKLYVPFDFVKNWMYCLTLLWAVWTVYSRYELNNVLFILVMSRMYCLNLVTYVQNVLSAPCCLCSKCTVWPRYEQNVLYNLSIDLVYISSILIMFLSEDSSMIISIPSLSWNDNRYLILLETSNLLFVQSLWIHADFFL